MDFAPGEDVDAVASVLVDVLSRHAAAGSAMDGARWATLCELGLPALRMPEPDGIGASVFDCATVAERIGAVLLPEPASAAMVLGPVVEGVLDGARVVAFAVPVEGCVRVGDDDLTDLVAVATRESLSALVLFDRGALAPVTERCDVDPSRPTVVCRLGGVEPVETVPMSPEDVGTLVRDWAVLTLGELVGSMQSVVDSTIAYVTERQQFGRSIGGFQAIKHQLADMYLAVEQARAAVQFAAIECDRADAAAGIDVAAAARWVPRAAIEVFDRAIHLHGAMGYSWEVGVHLHLRRAVATTTLLRESGVTESRQVTAEHGMAS